MNAFKRTWPFYIYVFGGILLYAALGQHSGIFGIVWDQSIQTFQAQASTEFRSLSSRGRANTEITVLSHTNASTGLLLIKWNKKMYFQ